MGDIAHVLLVNTYGKCGYYEKGNSLCAVATRTSGNVGMLEELIIIALVWLFAGKVNIGHLAI